MILKRKGRTGKVAAVLGTVAVPLCEIEEDTGVPMVQALDCLYELETDHKVELQKRPVVLDDCRVVDGFCVTPFGLARIRRLLGVKSVK